MRDLFKIVVYVLQRLLQIDKPMFGCLKRIDIFLDDGIRKTGIHWTDQKGAKWFE